jgi:hypothetical protein
MSIRYDTGGLRTAGIRRPYTIPYMSTYEGLQAIFGGYRIADPIALFEEGGLAAFERHYAEVSKRLGFTVEVPMGVYGGMVWDLSSRGRFAEAEEIGKKMLELDPKNTMTLAAPAQVAAMQKDDARAIGGSGASGDFRVFRASISTDVSSCAPSQTLAFPAIPQATTDGAAVSQLRKMTPRPQMHQNP